MEKFKVGDRVVCTGVDVLSKQNRKAVGLFGIVIESETPETDDIPYLVEFTQDVDDISPCNALWLGERHLQSEKDVFNKLVDEYYNL